MAEEKERLEQGESPNLPFLNAATWFMQVFTDACHHVKGEDILFKALRRQEVSVEHLAIMRGLEMDHERGRQYVANLAAALAPAHGRRLHDREAVEESLEGIIGLYPRHIKVEETGFFQPIMDYLTKAERAAIVMSMGRPERGPFDGAMAEWLQGVQAFRQR